MAKSMFRKIEIPRVLLLTRKRATNPEYRGGFTLGVSTCCGHWDRSGAAMRCQCSADHCPCRTGLTLAKEQEAEKSI